MWRILALKFKRSIPIFIGTEPFATVFTKHVSRHIAKQPMLVAGVLYYVALTLLFS